MTHPSSRPVGAVVLLEEGHASIGLLVEAYRTLCERGRETHAEKLAVVERLALELTLNAQVEQELLDPALRVAADDPSLMHSARDSVWSLVAHLSTGEPGEARFDTRLLLLADDLARQCAGARREIARRAQTTGLDLVMLGAGMAARRCELLAAYGEHPLAAPVEDESADPVGGPVSPTLLDT